jgi:3-hydroxyisobutyrate dehydrogenase-like beta-hydroxyacid dehydrogenase
MTALRPVGVVGTGAMGAPIAAHLARAGHPVTVNDRDLAAAAATGLAVVTTPAELGERCAVVLVVVDDDAAVRNVVGSMLDAGADCTVLICSTVLPATVQSLGAAAAGTGIELLDAAMVGGIRGVHAGAMTLLVGGDIAVLDSVRPELEPWTASVHHLGPLGAGQVAKSANNLIHWAQVCAIAEALRIVERAGLSVRAVREALLDGPADSRALRELEQMKLTWWHKDLAGSRALATEVGASHRMGDLCAALMPGIDVAMLAALLEAEPRERKADA